jgi:hypothetical protein
VRTHQPVWDREHNATFVDDHLFAQRQGGRRVALGSARRSGWRLCLQDRYGARGSYMDRLTARSASHRRGHSPGHEVHTERDPTTARRGTMANRLTHSPRATRTVFGIEHFAAGVATGCDAHHFCVGDEETFDGVGMTRNSNDSARGDIACTSRNLAGPCAEAHGPSWSRSARRNTGRDHHDSRHVEYSIVLRRRSWPKNPLPSANAPRTRAALPWGLALYDAFGSRQRPTPGLPHPAAQRLQAFSTS